MKITFRQIEKYNLLQAKEGDIAIFFFRRRGFEVAYQGDKYFIVPQKRHSYVRKRR